MMMSELEKMQRLLYEACIDYTTYGGAIFPDTADVMILQTDDGSFLVFGLGYNGVWSYSAEYVVRMLDRKFREGMSV